MSIHRHVFSETSYPGLLRSFDLHWTPLESIWPSEVPLPSLGSTLGPATSTKANTKGNLHQVRQNLPFVRCNQFPHLQLIYCNICRHKAKLKNQNMCILYTCDSVYCKYKLVDGFAFQQTQFGSQCIQVVARIMVAGNLLVDRYPWGVCNLTSKGQLFCRREERLQYFEEASLEKRAESF